MNMNETILATCDKYNFDQLAGTEHLIAFVEVLKAKGHVQDVGKALADTLEQFPKNASAFRQTVNKLRGDDGQAKVSKTQAYLDRAKV